MLAGACGLPHKTAVKLNILGQIAIGRAGRWRGLLAYLAGYVAHNLIDADI
jgi:hypothetical protein